MATQCPLCYTELERREVAPCYDCGHDPKELEHLRAREHTYAEVELLGSRIVLCDFCQADIASYDPTYFGQPKGSRLRISEFIRDIQEPRAELDAVCPECNRRLAFLRFVMAARSAPSA